MTYTQLFNEVGPATLCSLGVLFGGIALSDAYSRYKFGKTALKMDIAFNVSLIMFNVLIIYLMLDETYEKSATTILVLSIAVIQILKLSRDILFELFDYRYENKKVQKDMLEQKIKDIDYEIELETDEIKKIELLKERGKLFRQLLKYKYIK